MKNFIYLFLARQSSPNHFSKTVSLFSDLTKRVTLQNLFNDGGFSNMGVSDALMDTFTEDDV